MNRSRSARLFCLGASLLLACSARPQATPTPAGDAPSAAPKKRVSRALASVELPSLGVPDDLPWLAFGGGNEPLSNQISLAQDIGLLSSLLAGRGLVLFASGPGAPLAVTKPSARGRSNLRTELARLFGSPEAERTDYERAKLAIDGPSTSEHVKSTLARALANGHSPLFVYAACHGSPGETAAQNSLSLWGGWPLSVGDVASLLDAEDARPSRFVITACFGGGFADLLFEGADPERSVRLQDHCGLFAAPWDDEASGCDPNPDRRTQESYSIHFLHALSGKDRADIDRSRDIDLDKDGQIGLLEAHTWARIHSRSFDVPTTTSERFVRYAAGRAPEAKLNPLAAPEEVAVVKALGEELELPDESSARAKLAELDRIMDDAETAAEQAQKASDESYYALRIALLERYPLLEHAWEARAQTLLQQEGRAIAKLLTESDLAQGRAQAERELAEALAQHDSVRVARARVLRLVRAFETLRLASAIYKRGGDDKTRYDALRRCERWAPRLRARAATPH
jgi:hypothetical protein